MKRFLIIIFLVIFMLPVKAEEWPIDKIKQEAFKNPVFKINTSKYPAVDPNFKKNREIIKNNMSDNRNKLITVGNNGDYSVIKANSNVNFNYHSDGKLFAIRVFDKKSDI